MDPATVIAAANAGANLLSGVGAIVGGGGSKYSGPSAQALQRQRHHAVVGRQQAYNFYKSKGWSDHLIAGSPAAAALPSSTGFPQQKGENRYTRAGRAISAGAAAYQSIKESNSRIRQNDAMADYYRSQSITPLPTGRYNPTAADIRAGFYVTDPDRTVSTAAGSQGGIAAAPQPALMKIHFPDGSYMLAPRTDEIAELFSLEQLPATIYLDQKYRPTSGWNTLKRALMGAGAQVARPRPKYWHEHPEYNKFRRPINKDAPIMKIWRFLNKKVPYGD